MRARLAILALAILALALAGCAGPDTERELRELRGRVERSPWIEIRFSGPASGRILFGPQNRARLTMEAAGPGKPRVDLVCDGTSWASLDGPSPPLPAPSNLRAATLRLFFEGNATAAVQLTGMEFVNRESSLMSYGADHPIDWPTVPGPTDLRLNGGQLSFRDGTTSCTIDLDPATRLPKARRIAAADDHIFLENYDVFLLTTSGDDSAFVIPKEVRERPPRPPPPLVPSQALPPTPVIEVKIVQSDAPGTWRLSVAGKDVGPLKEPVDREVLKGMVQAIGAVKPAGAFAIRLNASRRVPIDIFIALVDALKTGGYSNVEFTGEPRDP